MRAGIRLFSFWVLLYRLGAGAALCLLLIQLEKDTMIDVTKFGVNDEYVVMMLVASLIVGFLAAAMLRAYDHNKAADNKAAKGTIASTNDLPYDKRYDLCTAVSFVLGTAIGMCITPVIINAFFIGAEQVTYCIVSALASAFFVVVLMRLLHLGLREFIIQASKYAVDTSKVVKDAKKDVDEAIDNLNQLNAPSKEKE